MSTTPCDWNSYALACGADTDIGSWTSSSPCARNALITFFACSGTSLSEFTCMSSACDRSYACFFSTAIALKGVHRLGVVLVGGHVVGVLHLANLGRRLLVALPHGDVLVKAGDLLRESRGIRLSLLDGSRQLLHLRVRLLDRALLLHRRVVAELLVGRELHLLLV